MFIILMQIKNMHYICFCCSASNLCWFTKKNTRNILLLDIIKKDTLITLIIIINTRNLYCE